MVNEYEIKISITAYHDKDLSADEVKELVKHYVWSMTSELYLDEGINLATLDMEVRQANFAVFGLILLAFTVFSKDEEQAGLLMVAAMACFILAFITH